MLSKRAVGVWVWLVLAVFSCSSSNRKFDEAGISGAGGGGGTMDIQVGGANGGGSSAAGDRGDAAGMSGEGGALADCDPADTRPCSEGGALGPCADGTETCSPAGTWGDCSVKPAPGDSCAADNDDNCNGIVSEGCPCIAATSRMCSVAGALGSCAAGTQACSAQGVWDGCSIAPAGKDSCVKGNDDNCNGVANEGCTCFAGDKRKCSEAGLVGPCAAGDQICTPQGKWGACSITPAAADTCEPDNNDNCSGAANEGCQCVNGVSTKPCGPCGDGVQFCTNGKTNQYGACTGAGVLTTYYQDLDGDGYGSAENVKTQCGAAPAGYTTKPGDCCDVTSNKALSASIHPGQVEFFTTAANLCGIVWNYDCSENNSIETSPAGHPTGCAAGTTYPTCAVGGYAANSLENCGKVGTTCYCASVDAGQGGKFCTGGCTGDTTVGCH